jgi:hypothetical protein
MIIAVNTPGQLRDKPIKRPNLISPPPIHLPLEIMNWMRKKLPPIIPEINKFHKLKPKTKFKINIIKQAGKVTISKIIYQRKS